MEQLCGPVGFGLVTRKDSDLLAWISDMALGFIGLSAGGHFDVSEMAASLGPAVTILCSLVLITYSGTRHTTPTPKRFWDLG